MEGGADEPDLGVRTVFCPSLRDLPSPPAGRAGWPWTEETPRLPETLPDGQPWPRVSIITPSYNQGQFLEETIRSVLLQGYPNLEYIIIDGGSTDGSVETIRKYAPWLANWVSERDRGQSHAINKGWQRATGTVLAWMNSDDYYCPNSIAVAGKHFVAHPEARLVYGNLTLVDFEGHPLKKLTGAYTREKLIHYYRGYYGISQPATFFHRLLLDATGPLDESLHYIMDYDLLLRASSLCSFEYVDADITCFRIHERSKTGAARHGFAREHISVARHYLSRGGLSNADLDGYLSQVRYHYSSTLVDFVLKEHQVDGRSPFMLLIQALWYYPRLWQEKWFRRHLVKAGLGPSITSKIRRLMKLLAGHSASD